MLTTPTTRRAAGAAILVVVLPLVLSAQQSSDTVRTDRTHAAPAPLATASPRQGSITIDGRLDEEAWSHAVPITAFTQTDPAEGKPATQRTEVRFLYDEDALYVGARMYDSLGAGGVTTRLVRRDANPESDWLEISIDAYHDHLGRAVFQLNPSGVKYDALSVGGSNVDDSWDPIWEGAARIDSLGWTAEYRIPYSQLRFSRAEVQTWGLEVRRFIQRTQERDVWAFWRKTEIGGPSRFGHLEGMRIASVPRHIEVVPYVVGRAKYVRPDTPGDPFNSGSIQDLRLGGDMKTLLSSNLTLDATFNPDFGQVEVDPASVNLSAFETFYAEKRPFFVAGSGIFDFGNFSCNFCSNFSSVEAFYSRRIGRAPQGADLARNAGTYSDIPESATILGAAKITGRTSNAVTVGILDAVTRREVARVIATDGTEIRREVEPLTNYFVARSTKDFRDGNVVIGGIATSTVRRLDDDSLRQRLNRHAETLGADLVAQWDQRNYSLFASVELANIAGDSAAILRAQRSSARYFQRPDRGPSHGRFFSAFYDSTATSMQGLGSYLRVAKDGGNFFWEGMANVRTPGFEVNDLAFLSRADYIQTIGNFGYNWTVPTSWYRTATFIFGTQEGKTFDGVENYRDTHLWLGGTTLQFWNANAWLMHMPQTYDDRALRGGPVATSPALDIVSLNVTSDSRRAVVVNANPQFRRNTEGGFDSRLNASARWKPVSNVSLTLGPSYELYRGMQQYVTTVDDPTNVAFFGKRYVLSTILQKTLSLDTRVAVTFSPTSSLELYVQPFFATAAYMDFKELDAPRQPKKSIYGVDRGKVDTVRNVAGQITSYTIHPDLSGTAPAFTIDNPDFSFRSLRGNAVYRWEYRPGSTLFVVWTQSREDTAQYLGTFDFDRERQALFGTHPDNIFLVKLSYWLGR